jgi:hypothetical protein
MNATKTGSWQEATSTGKPPRATDRLLRFAGAKYQKDTPPGSKLSPGGAYS